MTTAQLLVFVDCVIAPGFAILGWLAVDWWLFKRPLHAPTDEGRALRLKRAVQGRPLRYRCLDCGIKIRKHGWSPGWRNRAVPHDCAVCDRCVTQYPDHADLASWMSFDIVMSI